MYCYCPKKNIRICSLTSTQMFCHFISSSYKNWNSSFMKINSKYTYIQFLHLCVHCYMKTTTLFFKDRHFEGSNVYLCLEKLSYLLLVKINM